MQTLAEVKEEGTKITTCQYGDASSNFDEILREVPSGNPALVAYIYELKCKECTKNGRADLVFHRQYHG